MLPGIQGSVGLGGRQVAYRPAGRQDRLLFGASLTARVCRFVFVDADFAGRLVDWAVQTLGTTVSIVRKPADQKCFAVLPCRWVVERTADAADRASPDYERDPVTSEAMIRWAAIGLTTRRARGEDFHEMAVGVVEVRAPAAYGALTVISLPISWHAGSP